MDAPLRIAFFPDSFHETNGVAQTSRALVASAANRGFPFLCVHAGPATIRIEQDEGGRLELARGPVSFALEHDLRHDLLLWRHCRRVIEAIRSFNANIVHVTGPSDVGQLGAYVAHRLGLPLVGSWHTNLHDYAEWRARKRLGFLPASVLGPVLTTLRRRSLWAALRFYRLPSVLLAPNPELVDLLRVETGKPTYLMRRGVDTTLFSPTKRASDAGTFRFGFVGRLSSEKNVRRLCLVDQALLAAGHRNFRFVIVGDGSERPWLERHLAHAEFTGTLRGDPLARAYASMDLLIFPSETDTFGNVVLEALASGTPAVVSSRGGPKFIVDDGISGFVASDDRGFVEAALSAMTDVERHRRMRAAARRRALDASWDKVLDEVYEAYAAALGSRVPTGAP